VVLPVTEAELQQAVIACARLFGWRVAHFRPARTSKGWRTPVQADGKGFPDLVMVRKGVLLFAELKGENGRRSPEQQAWIDALGEVAVHNHRIVGFEWRPVDWTEGRIEKALR
jgi:VRR-NUC domain